MRAPAQHRRHGHTAAPGWAHPYTGLPGIAVFYNDGGNPPADPPKPSPPPASPEPVKQFTQEELERIAAREKSQGERAGARKALEELAQELGFTNPDDVKTFVATARKAQQDALSEEERRRQELERREAELAAREAAAIARERAVNRRAVLAGLGATGDDLEDAAALLRVDDDADETAVREAAEKLKERRPELFGTRPAAQTSPLPPAPGGAPAGAPPTRSAGDKTGNRGLEMARLRGHLKDKPAA
ncbi:hypothetical protein GCM10018777_56260 [Streptomyces albogriseolus]|uniref:hypothetical protein n=1 Tax=Streptomyces albogriseolus TaxID=1887 RepID=UPI00167376C5|nr:hypothetical protein [Streptomyces viridodiastaticus]GHG33007.1 hypothetical protein GCM10018777_56260 [Streptomyces viridodiastaticus]